MKFVHGEGCVEARWVGENETPAATAAAHKPTRVTVHDATNLVDVLGGTMQMGGEEEIYFPNVVLALDEQKKLKLWTEQNEWQYIDHNDGVSDNGITLTKKHVDRGVLWQEEKGEGL